MENHKLSVPRSYVCILHKLDKQSLIEATQDAKRFNVKKFVITEDQLRELVSFPIPRYST